jgi:ArsR family transcriptional regulator
MQDMKRHAEFDMAGYYLAFADRTRLRLLNLMDGRELCVCYFVEVLDEPQSKISRHLAFLRKAGVVVARREGTWMRYRIVMPKHAGAARILEETQAWMRDDRRMQADKARLADACCSPGRYAALKAAPAPALIAV